MASVFRPTRPYKLPPGAEIVERDGKPHVRMKDKGKAAFFPLSKDGRKYLKPAAKWYGKYRDACGEIQLTPLSPNRDAANMMLTAILKRVENGRSGIRDDYADHRKSPLTKLLPEYKQHVLDKGATEKESHQTYRRCVTVCDGCGFVFLSDLDATAAERWLADRRTADKKDGGFGPASSNHYTKSMKAFGNWLVKARRVPGNPFQHLTRVNADVDVRHQRRALAADEFTRLLTAARGGKKYRKQSGPDRAILYLVAGMTGLRASELASLTPESFSLDAETPIVTVEAAYSKHRRQDEVPLHADLVAELRPWLAKKEQGARVWPGKWAKHSQGVDMIRRDLGIARAAWIAEAQTAGETMAREASDFLAYADHDGEVADFHALRHTFITNLVSAGVQPKDAKELARHSTITLTMDRYSHVGVRDTAAALGKLVMPTNTQLHGESTSLRATGTDGGCTPDVPADVPAGGNGQLRLRTREDIAPLGTASKSRGDRLENKAIEEQKGPSETCEESTPVGTRTRNIPLRRLLLETQKRRDLKVFARSVTFGYTRGYTSRLDDTQRHVTSKPHDSP